MCSLFCLSSRQIYCLSSRWHFVCLVDSFRYNDLATLALAGPCGPRAGPLGPLRALRACRAGPSGPLRALRACKLTEKGGRGRSPTPLLKGWGLLKLTSKVDINETCKFAPDKQQCLVELRKTPVS